MVCNDLTSGVQSMKKTTVKMPFVVDCLRVKLTAAVQGRNVLFISHGHSMTDFLWKAGRECHLVFMGVARAVCPAVRQVLFLQLFGCGVEGGSAGGSFMSFMTSFMFKFCQKAGQREKRLLLWLQPLLTPLLQPCLSSSLAPMAESVVSLGVVVVCEAHFQEIAGSPDKDAMIMKRIFTSSGSAVSSVLEHLRSRAHMLGTSLSDPDHIRRKNPDALTRALVNPGNYFRLITVRLDLKEFQSMLKSNQVKERTGSAGYDISFFDVTHERWSLCLTQKVKLMRSEHKEHMCIKPKNPDPNQATWTLYLPVAEGCAFNGPEEFFRSGQHSRLWTLVKKHSGKGWLSLPDNALPFFEELHEATLFSACMNGASTHSHVLVIKMPALLGTCLNHVAGLASVWYWNLERAEFSMAYDRMEFRLMEYKLTTEVMPDSCTVPAIAARKRAAEHGLEKWRLLEELEYHQGEVKRIKLAMHRIDEQRANSEPIPQRIAEPARSSFTTSEDEVDDN
eukprot:s3482_g6.t1